MTNRFVWGAIPVSALIIGIHVWIWPESFSAWPPFYPTVYGLMLLFVMGGLALTGYLRKKHPELTAYALLGMNMLKMLSVLVMVLIAVYRFQSVSLSWSYPLLFLYMVYLVYASIASVKIIKN